MPDTALPRREVRWERMFPDELEAAFAACPVVYFAYGLAEPHGPQNALGLDILKAHAICQRAAWEHGGVVAPGDFWHIHECSGSASWAMHEIGEVERPWLTAVPPWHHFKSVLYHIRTADTLGFKAAILFTGHYGPNWNDLNTMVDLIRPHVGTRLYSLPDFEANTVGHTGSFADHAGRVETSQLWALEPELVDISRIPEEGTPGPHFAMGVDAHLADRKIGEEMVASQVEFLGKKAAELVAEYDRVKPEHKLKTFEDVEVLWRDVVKPHLNEFWTMKDGWNDLHEVRHDSRWYANWRIPAIAKE